MKTINVNGVLYLVEDSGKVIGAVSPAAAPAPVVAAVKATKGRKVAAVAITSPAKTFEAHVDAFQIDGKGPIMHTLRVWPYKGGKGGTISPGVSRAFLASCRSDAHAIELLRENASYAVDRS